MIIALWICATIGSLGSVAVLYAIFNLVGNLTDDDRMVAFIFALLGAMLMGASFLMFIVLTAIKAWS